MKPNFEEMSVPDLRAYVLEHREDIEAIRALFHHPMLKWTTMPSMFTKNGEPIEENIRLAEEAFRQRAERDTEKQREKELKTNQEIKARIRQELEKEIEEKLRAKIERELEEKIRQKLEQEIEEKLRQTIEKPKDQDTQS
jgi:transaldolase